MAKLFNVNMPGKPISHVLLYVFERWVVGLATAYDGLVTVVTLGWVCPATMMTALCWAMDRQLDRDKKYRDKKFDIRFPEFEHTVGDLVTPVTTAGLWLSTLPSNGEYHQQKVNSCVFKGVGIVKDRTYCIIDYDTWDEEAEAGECIYNIGKVRCNNYLIECDAGTGWAGEGAIKSIPK